MQLDQVWLFCISDIASCGARVNYFGGTVPCMDMPFSLEIYMEIWKCIAHKKWALFMDQELAAGWQENKNKGVVHG